MLASQQWQRMVEAEHAQSERMRAGVPPPVDFWQGRAEAFRADPFRTGDPLLERLYSFVEARDTLIDVGAGGGRLALPLAMRCAKVFAVEPSESMAAVLTDQATESGISNVTLVHSSWEEAVIAPGDVIICAHVVYTIRDIAGFLKKLNGHARRQVVVVVYNQSPQSTIYPLWKLVHGEERLPLPSLPELCDALTDLGIHPTLEHMEPGDRMGFDNVERALEQLGGRLYVEPGSPAASRLEDTLSDMLEEEDGRWMLKDAEPLHQVLVSWRPNQDRA